MRITRNVLLLPSAVLIVLAAGASTVAAQYGGSWKVNTDTRDEITGMSCQNPITQLGIESDLELQTGQDGRPSGGTVTFKSGVKRPMTPVEARSYWEALGGEKAAWDHWQAAGTLTTITGKESIPAGWLGREAHLVTVTGVDLFGILVAGTAAGEYALQIEGASGGPVPFTMDGVRQLQERRAAQPVAGPAS